jgi:hypothetical protein
MTKSLRDVKRKVDLLDHTLIERSEETPTAFEEIFIKIGEIVNNKLH